GGLHRGAVEGDRGDGERVADVQPAALGLAGAAGLALGPAAPPPAARAALAARGRVAGQSAPRQGERPAADVQPGPLGGPTGPAVTGVWGGWQAVTARAARAARGRVARQGDAAQVGRPAADVQPAPLGGAAGPAVRRLISGVAPPGVAAGGALTARGVVVHHL